MNPVRKKRLLFVIFLVIGVGTALSLVLYALNQNINLFYTPTQIAAGEVPTGHYFRAGGLVKKGSVKRSEHDLTVQFVLSDLTEEVTVSFKGILPDLFREGQGIVAQGTLNPAGVFIATQVLAKHDENYMPPEVKAALEKSKGAT